MMANEKLQKEILILMRKEISLSNKKFLNINITTKKKIKKMRFNKKLKKKKNQ